jgi:hypothetical protein
MLILNRAPPIERDIMLSCTNARTLQTGDLGHFTAHIHWLQIIAQIYC